MPDLSLVFDILARDKASGTMSKIGDQAETTGKRVVGGLKVIGGALAALGIGAFVAESVASLARIERINAQTEAVIRSTGGAAGVTAQHIEDYAGSLENATATEAESIQQGANLLATFTNIRNGAGETNDIFDQTVSVATDMARALNTTGDATIDMSGTAVQLGKALNDPIKGITALQKVGVSFTQTQKDQIAALVETGDVMGAQKIILAELTKEFGGSGEAFAATTAGKYELAKHALGTFGETILTNTLPALADLADFTARGFNAAAEGFESGEASAEGFDGVMQQVGVTIGDVADGVGFLVSVGQGFIGFVSDIPGPVLAGVGAMTAFALLKGPVGSALDTIALKALYARDSLVLSGGAAGIARAGMGGLVTALGGPVGIAIGAATIGLGFLVSNLHNSDEAADAAAQAQRTFADAIREANGVVDESVRQAAAKAAQDADLLDVTDRAGISANLVTDALTGNADAYDEVTRRLNDYAGAQGLAASFRDGNPEALQNESDAAYAAASSLADLAGVLPQTQAEQEQLNRATEESATASGGALAATDLLAASQQQLADDTSAAKQEVDGIRLALEQLGGATVNTDDLISQYYAAIAEATDATKDLDGATLNAAGGLDLQSAAGRAAQDVLTGIRGAGIDLIANQAQLGESTATLTGRATDLRSQFIAAAGQMGINEAAANALADQYGLIPNQVVTTVQANTATASARVSALETQLDALTRRDFVVTADVRASNPYYAQRAEGGPVEAGRTYLVGEEGPELVKFGASGFVTPADRTAQVLAGASRDLAAVGTGVAAGAGGRGGASMFEGNLYLDSGEFLGKVRGVAGQVVDQALGDVADAYFNAGGR